jgi:hypothetical protein
MFQHKPFRSNILYRILDRIVHGQPGELLPYSAVKLLEPHGQHHLGLQAICVANIVGSVNRHRDFDRRYRPKVHHLEDRWTRIQQLWHEGYAFPAIQVFQVGAAYFVKDGNHRVSVARSEGQTFIDAEVIAVDVLVPLEVGDTLEDVRAKGEMAQRLKNKYQPTSSLDLMAARVC